MAFDEQRDEQPVDESFLTDEIVGDLAAERMNPGGGLLNVLARLDGGSDRFLGGCHEMGRMGSRWGSFLIKAKWPREFVSRDANSSLRLVRHHRIMISFHPRNRAANLPENVRRYSNDGTASFGA